MADQPLLSRTSDSVVTLAGDLSSGRQLRKSCRFCRSRKIRCSGETDIGCLACRTRSQKCIYEPTAAMGRPRKYPRTEYCGDLCAPMPPDMHCHPSAPYHQRGWPHSAYLMRSLPPHDYWQAPPRNYETALPAWRPDEQTRHSSFNFHPSTNMLRDPFMPTLGGLPIPHSHRNAHSPQYPCGSDGILMNHVPSTSSAAPSLGNTVNFHHASTSRPGFQSSVDARFPHPPQMLLGQQNHMDNISMDFAGAHLLNGNLSTPQSPSAVLTGDPITLENSHEIISSCDARLIFQSFQGTTLHVATQAHLQFILREYPKLHVPVTSHKYPSVVGPTFYYTMLADVVSWIAYSQPSVSDRQDGSLNTHEPLFIHMLNSDRGGNSSEESTIPIGEGRLNPLEQLSTQEVKSIYSYWLRVNPFGFLFSDAPPNQQAVFLPENSALLATVVGWHFYLSSRSHNYNPPQTPGKQSQNAPTRCHMPFFEFAEAELMAAPMRIQRSTLTIVQALILLGAFRSVDSQARCGWALLSVAHLLAKEYLSPANGMKRPRSRNGELDMPENKMMGINWLMCLYKSWTLLSMKFSKAKVHTMIEGSPSYFEAFLTHARVTSNSTHHQPTTEWANRTLLNASQILEVFCTLCQEDPSNSLPRGSTANLLDRTFESNLYLVRWLMDTAKRRCQVMGSYDSPPFNNRRGPCEIRNAHTNTVLALVFSMFALSQLAPLETMTTTSFSRIPLPSFRDALKLLQIISVEGADSVVASAPSLYQSSALGEALLLRILRGFFPCLLILLQAFVNTFPDYCNTSGVDCTYSMNQLRQVTESLGKFASAGLSLYPIEDLQVIDDIRMKVVALSATLSTPSHLRSSQDAFQPSPPVPFLGTDHSYLQTSQPRDGNAHEPFQNRDEYTATTTELLLTNNYPSESANLIDSYSAPTTIDCIDSTLAPINGTKLSYNLTGSTDVAGVSSSPPLSDPPSSVSYPFQSGPDPEAKTEDILVPSQTTDLLLSLTESQALIEESERRGTELSSGVFRCPRGAEQYFCSLDSSWIPQQPSLDPLDFDSNSQPHGLDSFPGRTRTPHQISPPTGSPPSYS